MLNSSLASITEPSLEATELENLLIYLNQVHQVDLTGYKRSTLMRRTLVRMQQVGVEYYQGYLEYLQQHPNEAKHLLNTIFINFTYFFRDRPVWDYLEHEVIPQIIANKAPHEPIRVWSAGCASGEETYSLAMLLAEALGNEQFQQRVQIYGTDVDADAILQAKRGCYLPHTLAAVPHRLLERYFKCTFDSYRWRQEFCRSIIFRRHNLIQAPPPPHIDLLVCRNTLMYFTPETQLQVLARFHFSLKQDGFLLLGQAENLIPRPQALLFMPVYRQARVFTKAPDVHCESYLPSIAL